MHTDGFNHLALVTGDLDAFNAFYGDVFGAEVRWVLTEDGMRHAMLDVGGGACLHPFELVGHPAAGGGGQIFGRGHLDHFALDVGSVAAFEQVRAELVRRGASDGTVTDFGMVRTVTFLDPDGHEAEVALWCEGAPLTFADRRTEPFRAPSPAAG